MRKCKHFIDSYLMYTEKQESPELFHLWACFSIISAALGRKCWVDRGFYKAYPNQYIIFVSDSARCKKTTASDIAIDLYMAAQLPFLLKGKITGRGLSKHLHEMTLTAGTGSCFLYAPELGKIFGSEAYTSELMVWLTDLYGCPATDCNVTASQGIDRPKDIFLNLLGCTVPSWLTKMPAEMVEGGFSSRSIFVVSNKPRAARPKSIKVTALEPFLVEDLKSIFLIKGEFHLTQQAELHYDTWYYQHYPRVDEHDIRVRAYYSRKSDHVIKLGMCLSAATRDNRVIEHWEIDQALDFLAQIEQNMPMAFSGMSFSASTKYQDKVLEQIEARRGKIEWSELMRANRYYMSKEELEKLVEMLISANLIRTEIRTGKKWLFTL